MGPSDANRPPDGIHPDALGRRPTAASSFVETTEAGTLSITRVLRWEGGRSFSSPIRELPRSLPRPEVYCPFCGRSGRYAHTDRFRYYRHGNGEPECTEANLESALHRRAKRVLLEGLAAARRAGVGVSWTRNCSSCGAAEIAELLGAGAWERESEEESIEPLFGGESFRLDAAALGHSGVVLGLEVYATHASTTSKLDAFAGAGIPLLELRARDLVTPDGGAAWRGDAPLPVTRDWVVPATRRPHICATCVADAEARRVRDLALMRDLVAAIDERGLGAFLPCERCAVSAPRRLVADQRRTGTSCLRAQGDLFAEFATDFPYLPTLRLELATGAERGGWESRVTVRREDARTMLAEQRPPILPAGAAEHLRLGGLHICRDCRKPSAASGEVGRLWDVLKERASSAFPRLVELVGRELGVTPGVLRRYDQSPLAAFEATPEQFWSVPELRPVLTSGIRGRLAAVPLLLELIGMPEAAPWFPSFDELLEHPHKALAEALREGERPKRESLVAADRIAALTGARTGPWRGAAWAGEALASHERDGHTAWKNGRHELRRRIFNRFLTAHDDRRDALRGDDTGAWIDAASATNVIESRGHAHVETIFQTAKSVSVTKALADRLIKLAARTVSRHASLPPNDLFPDQQQALESAACSALSIITGGAGSGKTRVIRALVTALAEERWLLAAPTGKAADRLRREVARGGGSLDAYTVAKLVASPQLLDDATGLIVDEVGFLGESAAADLLERVWERRSRLKRLVLVGDPNQLPSIESGAVLRDLLAATLDGRHLFVQQQLIGSRRSAGRIAQLAAELLEGAATPDEAFQVRLTDDEIVAAVVDAVEERRGIDVQVIAHRNQLVDRLNMALRARLNPEGRAVSERVRLGDRVMATENRYLEPQLRNGEIGTLALDPEIEGAFRFVFDDGQSRGPFGRTDLALFKPAYAITIHKSQGSEWSHVIVALPSSGPGLTVEMLYTAVTRGKEDVLLLGDPNAFLTAARARVARQTTLQEELVRCATAWNRALWARRSR